MDNFDNKKNKKEFKDIWKLLGEMIKSYWKLLKLEIQKFRYSRKKE
jgi:hypothetical protein